MDSLNNITIDTNSFTYKDLQAQDQWIAFTPVFGSITLVGAATYVGRLRLIGKMCQFQVTLVAATSIATTAGTDYMTLPRTAKGLTGLAVMTNDTTNIAVGLCHIDVTTSRCYMPTQVASGNTFNIYGSFEV